MTTDADAGPVGVLVLRVWKEGSPPRIRARVTQVLDVESPQEVVTTASSMQEIQATVAAWLARFQST